MTHKLFIATPSRDRMVTADYSFAMRRLLANPPCEVAAPETLYDEDLVRVRSRYVADFLETDCTDLLWIDSDIAFHPSAVAGMLATELDYVAAPYPKKRIDWDAIAVDREHDPEAAAYAYPVVLLPGGTRVENDIANIGAIGLGMTLMSRAACERLIEHYGRDPEPPNFAAIAQHALFDEASAIDALRAAYELGRASAVAEGLRFRDLREGAPPRSTVALFQLVLAEHAGEADRDLLSEDFSLCARWRAIGGQVWLYLGPGSPVSHVGVHVFRGRIDAFGRREAVR